MAISFLKKGKEAHEALRRADEEQEKREKARGVRRFWVPEDAETQVTFLDGKLSSDGLLDVVRFKEHRVYKNGHWRNFYPCTAEQEPCPLCEMDNYASLVSLFTVIDHSRWKDKNGKWHQHEKRLFVVKPDTMKRLQKMATKRGGLAGWTVTIGRTGTKSPEVGTDFDFEEQHDLKELAQELKLKPEDIKPFNYEEVIVYYTADELRDMGFGGAVVGREDSKKLRSESKLKSKAKADDDEEDEDEEDEEEKGMAPPKKKKVLKFGKAKTRDADEDEDEDSSGDSDEDEFEKEM